VLFAVGLLFPNVRVPGVVFAVEAVIYYFLLLQTYANSFSWKPIAAAVSAKPLAELRRNGHASLLSYTSSLSNISIS